MGNKTILLSHPTGNSNVRALLGGLIKAGLLGRFYTCIAILEDSFLQKFARVFPISGLRKRVFNSDVKPYLYVRPLKEIGRLISQKVGWKQGVEHEEGIFCIDKVYSDLDRFISKNLNNIDAVYAYEDGALSSFRKAKAKGIFCIYDLPTGYWRAHDKYLIDERINRPEWMRTVTCVLDSKEKLAKKDEELALADIIFVASNFTKKTLELYPGILPPVYVIPYGFPPICEKRTYKSLSARKINLLFVGNLTQLKGIANVLEAAKILKGKVNLTIVGKRTSYNFSPLEKELAKHTWIPSLPNEEVLALMRQQDILIFPSLFEGYGLVVAEAMSQGTPVITTNRTCGANFIEDGINGWIVPAGNTSEIVKTLNKILEHPECIAKIGTEALKTAAKSPMSIYGDKLSASIEDFIKSN
ncbi:glycosyltransferase family 4 protein [Gillisia marina]|uniref:glycosyltransferase family 4 protein n=1 Tax=Gillisia marina TaxID=1167637 RepID=UPI000299FB91|nr:glycosyltransferase family 4 protein [Gillisia marina]